MAFTRTLYPYQVQAKDEMVKFNTLLAFDMGTGKTPTTLAAIEELRSRGEISDNWPGLIVTTASTKWQWRSEVMKFTTSYADVIEGTPKQREDQYRNIERTVTNYVIVSYGTFVRDHLRLRKIAPEFIVLDEATAIKSFKSQRSKVIKKVAKAYPIRHALTGTPIENGKLEEVYSILEFVDPELLGKWWDFERKYVVRNPMGWIERYKNVDDFHWRISGTVQRRTMDDPEVAAYLPKEIHNPPIIVPWDKPGRRLYDKIAAEVLSDLDDMVESMSTRRPTGVAAHYGAAPTLSSSEDRARGELMSKVTTLRMLCNGPIPVVRSAVDYASTSGLDGSKYAASLVDAGKLDSIKKAPKQDALVGYLQDFLDANPANKAVVFTSYLTSVFEIVAALADVGIQPVSFTGMMSPVQRDEAKRRFVTDPDTRVFVSSDAGGYGVDLPVANLLVNFDLPWQAGMARQRNARIRRASSEWKHVVIQDFLMEDSIEIRLADVLAHKVAVAKAALDGEYLGPDGSILSDVQSLREFLKNILDEGLTHVA